MDHPPAVNDDTLTRLRTLTATLTEQLAVAESTRARLTEALAANAWPRVRAPRPAVIRGAGER